MYTTHECFRTRIFTWNLLEVPDIISSKFLNSEQIYDIENTSIYLFN